MSAQEPAKIGLAALHLAFQERYRFKLPRVSLAIGASIAMQFPQKAERRNIVEMIRILDFFSPLQIALNELADIGISARMARDHCKQDSFYDLLDLENRVYKDYEIQKRRFCDKYPGKGDIIDIFEHDFLLLSRNRNHFAPTHYPEYIELDSGIFVAANIALACPDILDESGVNMNMPAESLDDLREKYSLFRITSSLEKRIFKDSAACKLLALHCSQMCMKVNDDGDGVHVDTILNVPNLLQWAQLQENPHKSLQDLKARYKQLAIWGGVHPWYIGAAERLCQFTSRFKANKATLNNRYPGRSIVAQYLGFGRITTVLRHELEHARVLDELFRYGIIEDSSLSSRV